MTMIAIAARNNIKENTPIQYFEKVVQQDYAMNFIVVILSFILKLNIFCFVYIVNYLNSNANQYLLKKIYLNFKFKLFKY